MMIVIALILILAGLMFPVVNKAIDKAKKLKAYNEVRTISLAWTEYLRRYTVWPNIGISEGVTAGEMQGSPFLILTGMATNIGGPYGSMNIYGIQFIEATEIQISKNAFIDPWNKPYKFMFDLNYDQKVVLPWKEEVYTSVAVWSTGPDKKDDTAIERKDDIRSW